MTFLDLLVGNQSRFRYAKADEATTSLRHLIHRHAGTVGRVPINGFERTHVVHEIASLTFPVLLGSEPYNRTTCDL